MSDIIDKARQAFQAFKLINHKADYNSEVTAIETAFNYAEDLELSKSHTKQTIFRQFVDGSTYDEDKYKQIRRDEEELRIMLECGAKVLSVTPILSTRHDQGSQSAVTYTRYLSYIIEEPDTNEYRTAKNDKMAAFYDKEQALKDNSYYSIHGRRLW